MKFCLNNLRENLLNNLWNSWVVRHHIEMAYSDGSRKGLSATMECASPLQARAENKHCCYAVLWLVSLLLWSLRRICTLKKPLAPSAPNVRARPQGRPQTGQTVGEGRQGPGQRTPRKRGGGEGMLTFLHTHTG